MTIPIIESPELIGDIPFIPLSESLPLFSLPGLLTRNECESLITLAKPKLVSSKVANSSSGKPVVKEAARTSRTAFLTTAGIPPEDEIMLGLLQKLVRLTNYPITHFEGIKVVNYDAGDYYNQHWDHFKYHPSFRVRGGERIFSLFVYLNTLPEDAGGATYFPKLDLRIQPQQGQGVLWMNRDRQGHYFEESLHAGEELREGFEKWGLNIWVREFAYSAT